MTVLIPALDEHQKPYEVRPTQKRDTLLERNKLGRMTDLLTLSNKSPMWNEGKRRKDKRRKDRTLTLPLQSPPWRFPLAGGPAAG